MNISLGFHLNINFIFSVTFLTRNVSTSNWLPLPRVVNSSLIYWTSLHFVASAKGLIERTE